MIKNPDVVTARIGAEYVKKLDEMAVQEDRNRAQMVRMAVREFVQRREAAACG